MWPLIILPFGIENDPYMHTCTYTHIHIHTRTHAHTHLNSDTQTHVYMHAYMLSNTKNLLCRLLLLFHSPKSLNHLNLQHSALKLAKFYNLFNTFGAQCNAQLQISSMQETTA